MSELLKQGGAPAPSTQAPTSPVIDAPQTQAVPAAAPTEAAAPPQAPEKALEGDAEEKDPRFASKFAALSRREKQLFQREQKLKEIQSKYADYDQLESKIKADPLGFLQEKYGLSYNDLTKLVLNDNKPTPEMKVKEVEEKLARWEKEQAEKEKKALESQYEQTITGFKTEIDKHLKDNADTYELTLAMPEGPELVYNVIEAQFEKTGRVMTTQEAAEYVEKYLEGETKRLFSLKKFQKEQETAGAPPPKAPEAGQKVSQPQTTSKTLTNSQQTEVPAPVDRPLSVEESKALASKLIRWTT